jgi:hypothetical protein
MEQEVVGVKIESGRSTWKHESDTSIVNEVNTVKEIYSEQPEALENAPETVTRTMDFPSTSGYMSNTHKEQMELNFSSNLTAVDVRTKLFFFFLFSVCLSSCNFYSWKKNDFLYSGG